MKLLPEDPRLTAYALGEIEDEQERAEIQAAVAQSSELQAEVDSIREMSALLSSGLGAEAAPELSEFEKARMEAAPPARSVVSRLISWPVLTSAAAVALLAFVLMPDSQPMVEYAYQAEERLDATDSDSSARTSSVELKDEVVARRLQVAQPMDALDEEAEAVLDYDPIPVRGRREAVVGDDALQMAASTPKPAPVASKQLYQKKPSPQAEAILGESIQPSLGKNAGRAGTDSFGLGVLEVSSYRSDLVADGVVSIPVQPPVTEGWNTESYDTIEETDFRSPLVAPLSTFSIDVDTASYANVRRFLNQGQLPPADAVRIEELINYFPYSDAAPTKSLEAGGDPFAVHVAQTYAPWNESNRLLRIALKGYEMPWEERPASNLVFLLDVSGSMNSANKLLLIKESMELLIRRLDQRDRVAVVVYAGASGLVLPSTTANNHETIEHALANLSAGGSTNAGAGIELAYKVARDHFIEGGNNRVILCTDGDFNVGQTNKGQLAQVAEKQAEKGVSLTILGFGMGNFKDDMLEELSNKGKGTYAYVDSHAEARKVFVEDLASNIFKIAKDVKIQVEFNPEQVKAYRLIGYENRRLKAEDFNNDKKKAGDIGPGHTVVALYEVVPAGAEIDLPNVDALRYQKKAKADRVDGELATVKLRYKQPEGDVSKLISHPVSSEAVVAFKAAPSDLRFSAAVAAFGMRLTDSAHAGELSYAAIETIAINAIGKDSGGHRSEFSELVRKADALTKAQSPTPAAE